MKRVSNNVVFSICCLFGLALSSAYAQSGKWPEKSVRLILASPVGSGDDFVARLIAPKLAELLGQQFIVENRAGSGGLIGQLAVLKSPADGYTFLLAGGSMAGARYVNLHATYDVLRDYTPVSLVEVSAFVMLVHPSIPVTNLKDFIALARSRPGELTYGSTGAGQIPTWSALLFNDMARIKALEVPYKGIAEAAQDAAPGRIAYIFAPFNVFHSYAGRLRVLGVTSPKRTSAFPELPTISEAGVPGFEMPAWRSIMGPAGMSQDIVGSLNTAIIRVLGMPDVRKQLQSIASEPAPSSPDELRKRYGDWMERFGKIARQAGIKPQ